MEISITWSICRVCLVEEVKKPQMAGAVAEPMHHIFNEDKVLAKQIYDCSGITMKPNDNLPEKICKKCYTLLKYAVNFRETCRVSDAYLQNILQRTKSASRLLKEQQQPAACCQDPFEEIISSDCLSDDNNNDGAANDPLFEFKCRKRDLEKRSQKFEDTEYSDLIEFGNEDFLNENCLKNSVVDNKIISTAASDTDKHYEECDDGRISFQLKTSPSQKFEENQETEPENFKLINHVAVLANIEKEDNVESYEQLEEFIVHKERYQRDIISDMESESEDSQAKVSSTVAVREDDFEIVELEAEYIKSSEADDMQTEYIMEEFAMDDNSSHRISLQNSATLFVHPKEASSCAKQYQPRTNHTQTAQMQVWVCDMCGNHFDNRQILKLHIKVHRQEKNHECEICLKRFITACNLQAHMRIHTGEKPFECKYCGRRFNDRSSNLRHERTHTNERPFQCTQCGKAFSLGLTLKKHLKVHTGERSFSCDVCAKSFKLNHQLKAHKNSTLHKALEQLIQADQ